MKLISVIIPCFNSEKYIAECLQSIINQTYIHWEIICVNDGSTDGTLEILHLYKNKYPDKITVLSTTNSGASAARNTGLKLAKGDYIQFVDADDLITNDKFEKQLAGFTQNADVILSDRVLMNTDLTHTLQTFTFSDINTNPLETAITRIIITGNPLYTKACVNALNGYDASLKSSQDWDFHIRLVIAGYRIGYVEGVFYINRQVSNSISHNWKKVSIDAAQLIIRLKPDIERSPLINIHIRQHLAQIYMNSAIFSHNTIQSNLNIDEMKHWANGNYSFITNPIKKVMLIILGADALIKLQHLISRKR